jgi:hypothetical protein
MKEPQISNEHQIYKEPDQILYDLFQRNPKFKVTPNLVGTPNLKGTPNY